MEYIDKTILQEEGEEIIRSFLKQLKEDGANYPNDLYDSFKSARTDDDIFLKDKLIEILLREQSHYCCYCMRRLTEEDELTLEHLILNSITRKERLITYFKRETALNGNVCLAADFIANEEIDTPPYPHTVAYQNLVASCNGCIRPESRTAFCCNIKRSNEYIEPIVLYPTIKDEIRYKPNGRVIWINEEEEIPTVNKLGLNDDILRMIRRIWLYSKDKDLDINGVERRSFLYELLTNFWEEFAANEELFNMLLNFQNDSYWNLLKKYSYFGQ